MLISAYYHYNKFDFFQGSKPLKKVLKTVEKIYFKSPIDPWEPSKYMPSKKKF